MKFQILDHARDYIVQLFVYRQTIARCSVRSRRTGYRSRKLHLPTSPLLIVTLLGLTVTIILTGCTLPTGNSPIVAQDDDIVLIPSPTPRFVLPGPDDEDPRMDCVLDAPACIIGAGIESIDGAAYIGASIAIDRSQLEDFKGSDEELVLDAKVAISNEGMHAGDIEVQEHTIAVASPDADLVLTSPGGDPMVNVITTVDGFLFHCTNLLPRCPQPPQAPYFSFDVDTGDIRIHSNEGDILITIDNANQRLTIHDDSDDEMLWGDYFSLADVQDPGIVLNDREGNPVATLISSDGVLFVFEPNGSPFATIEPNTNGSNQPVLNFIDSDGNPSASLSLREGGIFIDMGLGGAPVAIVTPNNEGVWKVEEGESIILTTYIPVTGWVLKEVDLTGTVDLYTKDATGQRTVVSEVPVDIKIDDFTKYMKVEEGEPGKSPTATPAENLSKDTTAPTKAPSKDKEEPQKEEPKQKDTPVPKK
jgi:hypothetical protein